MAKAKAKSKPKSAATTVPLKIVGKKVVLTGKFPKKEMLQELIVVEGGTVSDKVTAKVDFLVVGATRGSGPTGVEKDAQKLNQRGATIQIVDESSFYALLAPTRDELLTLLKSPAGLVRIGARRRVSPRGYRTVLTPGFPSLADADLRNWTVTADGDSGDLRGLIFDGADMRGARLAHVKFDLLKNVNLDGAMLDDFRCKGLVNCTVRKAAVTNIQLNCGDLGGSDFSGSSLHCGWIAYAGATGTVFRNCEFVDFDFQRITLERADFTDAKLAGANMQECHFTDAILTGADLQSTNLSQAVFIRANLKKTDLRGANLRQADLTGATVDVARFDGADLVGAKISAAQFGSAKGAKIEQIAGPGAIGPNLRQLDAIARAARYFETRAIVHTSTESVTVEATMHDGVVRGKNSAYEWFQEPTLLDVVLSLSRYFHDGVIDPKSVRVSMSRATITSRVAQPTIVAAWSEAFGILNVSDAVITQRIAEKRAAQEAFRKTMLNELRKGPSGVTRWNKRTSHLAKHHPQFRRSAAPGANLRGIEFDALDLQESNFRGADLTGANMRACDLSRSALSGAVLCAAELQVGVYSRADFSGANLTAAYAPGADFRQANFRRANLSGIDLGRSDLCGADFTGANLTEADLAGAKYDETTRWPTAFSTKSIGLVFKKTKNPKADSRAVQAPQNNGPIELATFLKRLQQRVEKAKYDKAVAMLKADSFKLFAQVEPESVIGVVKSQTDPDLVYSCRLAADGKFACCTQNLNICGGLRGSLCKHHLVLIIGLANGGELDPTKDDVWIEASRLRKPELEKDTMSEAFLRYKGAEAGEVDWRPTETIPEDYYAL